MIRQPVAIGRFYPQNAEQLHEAIPYYFALARAERKEIVPKNPWALMLPHAGYVYCGKVIAQTLLDVCLPEELIILCPNHTGRGKPLGVWPKGAWRMPFGDCPVSEDLASFLTKNEIFVPDYLSHQNEHSIEVLLPFLYYACGQKTPHIVPVCIGTQNPDYLKLASLELSRLLNGAKSQGRHIGLIVSSDMNHYEDHETCMRKDNLALHEIFQGNGESLLAVCARENITMCGVAPMAMALFCADHAGKREVTLLAHTSSAEASGNFRQTVGYAGVHIALSA